MRLSSLPLGVRSDRILCLKKARTDLTVNSRLLRPARLERATYGLEGHHYTYIGHICLDDIEIEYEVGRFIT